MEQRAHERGPLLHPPGQLVGVSVLEPVEPNQVNQVHRPLAIGVLIHAEDLDADHGVLQHVPPR